jgi:xylulokinase
MPLFLGVDLGTSSLKAAVLDERGRVVTRARIPSATESPRKNFYEVNAETNWWGGFLALCEEVGKTVSLKSVAALCVSSVCASFVPIDEEGTPTHNAILYGIDKRATEQIGRLNRRYGEKLDGMLGGPFTTHSILPKVLWLKENRPEVYKKTALYVEPNNFITYRLTGTRAWDFPSAAAAGLVDRGRMSLPVGLFVEQGISPSCFPDLRWPLSVLGGVTKAASQSTGLPAGIPVITGACDINAEAAAARAMEPGECVVVFGSTVSVLLTTQHPARLSGFVTGISLLEGTYRLGAATSSGSRFLQWLRSVVQSGDSGKSVSPTGILMLPWLDGARTPFHNPEAKMLFSGMNSGTSPADFLLAGREALGYELDGILSLMETAAPLPETINVSGGLCNDMELMQLVCSMTGRKLRLHPSVDAACGDAVLAAIGSGFITLGDVKRMEHEGPVLFPDPALHALFAPLKKMFRDMADKASGRTP